MRRLFEGDFRRHGRDERIHDCFNDHRTFGSQGTIDYQPALFRIFDGHADSAARLREWHDVHQQIRELVLEMGLDRKSLLPAKQDVSTKHRLKRSSPDQHDTGRQTVP